MTKRSRKAPFAERGHDLYETPAVAVHALLRVEKLPLNLWEPACGPGAIARVLREAGHKVIATDLAFYESFDMDECDRDFLLETAAPPSAEAIVTNPPFKIANKFVAHALELCPRVIMLLKLTFLESVGRSQILEGGHLARVHVFRNRLPMMHRDGWTGNRTTSDTAYAWYVWDRNHEGKPEINRISWTKEEAC